MGENETPQKTLKFNTKNMQIEDIPEPQNTIINEHQST